MDTCHGFNLNVDPPSDLPNLHLKQILDPETSHDLVEMVRRIEKDNAKIIKSLAELFDKYEEMHRHLIHLINPQNSTHDDASHVTGKKRKAAVEELSNEEDDGHVSAAHSISGNSSDEICCRISRMINYKPKISTNFIRIDKSDTSLTVKDGYQWRKYGQKVTRDNPSPRAYYKCSFAPLCSVKKKVQRSVEDTTVAVVTYEGEHNHKKPPAADFSQLSSRNVMDDDVSEARLHIVEQMASALTKKPSFTSELASAIYSQVLQQKSYSG